MDDLRIWQSSSARGEFECHVAGEEPQAVNTGSAPVGNEPDAAAGVPEATPHVFDEADYIRDLGIHQHQCYGHKPACRRGMWARAHTFTRR